MSSKGNDPTTHRALLAVVGLSLALNVTAVWWGLPSRNGWAVDELNPSVILEGIETRFSGDWHQPAYPPFHYYVLATTYLPLLALDAVDVASVSGHTLFFYLGRVVTLAMGVGILLVVWRLAIESFGEEPAPGVLGALAVALSPPFVYYSKTANLDVPLTFWAALSLLFFMRLVKRDALRDYLGFTLTAVLAMGTKDQAFAFYVLPVAAFGVMRVRRAGSLLEGLADRRIVLSLLVGIASFLAMHNVVFNYRGFVHHFEEILWARGHYRAFENTPGTQLDLLRQTLRHVGFTLGWPLALAALGGIGVSVRKWRERPLPLWLLLAVASYYLFFIAPVLSTWLRYALPFAALLAPFAGVFLAALWRRGAVLRAGVALLLLYSLARAASVNVLLLEDSRYEAERWLRENVAAGETVGFMGQEYYLPRLHEFRARRLRPTESVLEREKPRFLVINRDHASRFDPGTREGELFSNLALGRTRYALVFSDRSRRGWSLLDFEGVLANMSKIGPPIEVYERIE